VFLLIIKLTINTEINNRTKGNKAEKS